MKVPFNGNEQLSIGLYPFWSPMKSALGIQQNIDEILIVGCCQMEQLLMDTIIIHAVTLVHHLGKMRIGSNLLNHDVMRWFLSSMQSRKLRHCKIFTARICQIL